MCGFTGVLHLNGKAADDTCSQLVRMQHHRGPDDDGFIIDRSFAVAHKRLRILDLSKNGQQPMQNRCTKNILAYAGEVYNYLELKKTILTGVNQFHSTTDTEVVLYLLEQLGIDAVQQFNGMFSFAFWDKQPEVLYLARDPFGIKPLFYLIHQNALWFSTEIKSLLTVPGFTKAPSLQAAYHYLSLNYIPGELTAFEQIKELRPGTFLKIKPGMTSPITQRYFDFNYQTHLQDDYLTASIRVKDLVHQAVERQLRSDVPVGIMLSGGIDSSVIAAAACKLSQQKEIHTFSLGFNEPSFDESEAASLMAAQLKTTHHHILVTPQKVSALLSHHLTFIDEPYADGSAIPTYLLAEEAKKHVGVVLSGEGGDELFAGYDTYRAFKFSQFYRFLPRLIRTHFFRNMVKHLPVSFDKLSFDYKAKRFVEGAELEIPIAHFYWRHVLPSSLKLEILQQLTPHCPFPSTESLFVDAYDNLPKAHPIHRLMHIDLSYHLPDDLMIKNDRMTMAHSLEARVPFTDIDLVRYVNHLPLTYKMRGFSAKAILKQAFKAELPDRIVNKKKIGLEMPYSTWLRHELHDQAKEILSKTRVANTEFLAYKPVSLLWNQHQSRKSDQGRAIWGLLMYLQWFHMHF